MKFYGRKQELMQLRQWEKDANSTAQMTVVVGRRRIGKTTLLKEAYKSKPFIYFFVAKKNEALLCEEFVDNIKATLHVDIAGELRSFREVFKYLMILSETVHFTLAIDEFQEFYNVNHSVYSEMQNIWDAHKAQSKINLVICGSVYSLMKKIFENSKEPLFQRASHRIILQPFSIDVLKHVLSDNAPRHTNEDLLAFYMATGGVARYMELLAEARAFTKKKIIQALFEPNSYFMDEGKNVIIEEFSRDYSAYFSILSLIASSKTSRPEIEGELGQSVGPYIEKLENEFNLIRRVIPIFSKPGTRQIRYTIDDNFLNFWFRFVYKYRSAIEISNIDYVRNIFERDYNTYIGRILEKYFREKLILSKKYSAIGSYWESGNKNEIDIVAINEDKKKILIGEVKRNPKEIKINELKAKAINICNKYHKYDIAFAGYSINDM